ncbi:MAG: hypothetical protein ACLVJO_08545 [[Clostridium] scindens]
MTDSQEVRVGKKVIRRKKKKVILAFYSGLGIICTEERGSVTAPPVFIIRCASPMGRLDKVPGLLIMTNDGDLINGMIWAVITRRITR